MTALKANIFVPKLHVMTLHSRCSNINLKDIQHGGLKWFIWPRTEFSSCFPTTW